MRSGVCALQQTLTAEAASVLKHSLGLARRRGHAQVTPLHVAATLLTSRASLLRRACLKSHNSHSHNHHHHQPLQCRALELCFNVALNRLPTTPGGPLLQAQQQPCLSNALIAALKRAQAHQRRGCIEQQQQQQPLLTIKVELEQLIISILDDPSVSRVMREAGFSSTAVKNNLEDSSLSSNSVFHCYTAAAASATGGVFSTPCSPTHHNNNNNKNFWHTHFLSCSSDQNPFLFSSPPKKPLPSIINITTSTTPTLHYSSEDIKLVLEVLLRKKKRNTVVVGDSSALTEGLVGELMAKLERGEVPEELKTTRFVKFQFSPVALELMRREDAEKNVLELKRKVDSLGSVGEGAIIYVGDLKWTVDIERSEGGYSPADHLVGEIARLVLVWENKPKVWIMGSASYQTYMRCQMREPPLETEWALQAVSVPSGGLGLTLHASSVHESRIMLSQSTQSPSQCQVLETKPLIMGDRDHNLTCCAECASNCEKEAQLLKSNHPKLPAWLQPHGTQPPQKDELVELKKKWSRLCYSLHQERSNYQISLVGKSCSYTSSYPWWPNQNSIFFQDSNSISFGEQANSKAGQSCGAASGRFRRQQSCIEFDFGDQSRKQQQEQEEEVVVEPSLESLLRSCQGKEVKITLALGNSVFSVRSVQRAEMCRLLKENVPWQSETIPSIVEAMIVSESAKRETWLLIKGNDTIGKRRLARAIAESLLGSADSLLHSNQWNYQFAFGKALKTKEINKLVVLVEDIDSQDSQFMKFLADGFETGRFGEATRNGGQTIFILTKGDTNYLARENDMKNKGSVIQMTFNVSETTKTGTTLVDQALKLEHKRKATSDWELPDKEFTKKKTKEGYSRQSSFNTLDLNIKANEDGDENNDEDSEDKRGELSPISSDLTRETANDIQNPNGFLESIENVFVFNRSPARDREMRELFEAKMEGMYGINEYSRVSVEERVLEEVCFGSGSFPNSLFEKWLKDVFQTALKTVRFSGKEGIGGVNVRLCLGGNEHGILEDGFMGSCLPNKIHVSYKD